MPIADYRAEVFRFADAVEGLFRQSKPKVPSDELDRLWYPVFWAEWRRLRNTQN